MSVAQIIAQQVAVKHMIEAAERKKLWLCGCAACVVVRTDPTQYRTVLTMVKGKGYVVKSESTSSSP